jgi:hypothetical protein
VRLKPPPRYLTGFYLMVSLGGAIGGLFVGVIGPNVFNDYYEFPIGLALCAILAATLAGNRKRLVLAVPLAAYLIYLAVVIHGATYAYRFVGRNFYGRLAVYDDADPNEYDDATRTLAHGVINHGQQPLNDKYRRMPISYFCPQSGIGLAMRAGTEETGRRIGVLGLGCGSLAGYGRKNDTIRMYEINPLARDIARSQFSYLRDTPAKVELVMGDGRLSLERESSQQFDLLVMDAFSGDAVPVHLLTKEAFVTYFRHLRPGGILAVNMTNRYLDFRPVLSRAAAGFGRVAMGFEYRPAEEDTMCSACSWALLIDPAAQSKLPWLKSGNVLTANPKFREWTDDFSNLLSIMR